MIEQREFLTRKLTTYFTPSQFSGTQDPVHLYLDSKIYFWFPR